MNINLKDYYYELPEEKIAKHPVEPRDSSKLLIYDKGEITHNSFNNLSDFLTDGSFLFFNDTKVIPARLFFKKITGSVIEIFLLEPFAPTRIVSMAMQEQGNVVWKCLVGNKKRWKNNEKLFHEIDFNNQKIILEVEYDDFEKNLIRFNWTDKNLKWVDILQIFGEIPLPPYFKRKPNIEDEDKYQTVFAKQEGAVAAPTAGLHFTDAVLKNIEQKGILKDFITLHVSAGTFQPIKVENVTEHVMHSEQIIFSLKNVENIFNHLDKIIAVGTTSLRALESLYWFGVKLLLEKNELFFVKKLYPYEMKISDLPETKNVFQNLISFMKKNNISDLMGETEIFIFPGYDFKVCKGLITNYHLPETTLILLVAAFIGDHWKKVYGEALDNNYRFLSYGDSSLLLP